MAPKDDDDAVAIAESYLFEREWYLATYPDVGTLGADPLQHYLLVGAAEGRRPNQWFDVTWYRATYQDAASALNPLLHYIRSGAEHNNAPHPKYSAALLSRVSADKQADELTPLGNFIRTYRIVEASALFEPIWYLDSYPDVKAAGVDPLAHFLVHGAGENRNPNRAFDVAWYRATYPSAAVSQNPLLYYLREGATRGHTTHPAFHFDLLPGKRTGGYSVGCTPLGELLRAWAAIESTFLLERDWYLDQYKDVAASGDDPLQHYLLHGVSECRNPNRLFDGRWYLSQYPKVAAAGQNPLAHYILEGAKQGYKPHPFFPTEAYFREHAASASPGAVPLEDFLRRVLPAHLSAFPKFSPYDVYRATQDNLRRREHPAFVRHVEIMSIMPTFLILIDGADELASKRTLQSLDLQIYRRYVPVRTRQHLLDLATPGDDQTYVMWLGAGDEIDPDGLYAVAAAINADADLDLIYFDHDVATVDELSWPLHKPDWSPDYFESSDYIGPAVCFRAEKVRHLIVEARGLYDLLLRVTEATTRREASTSSWASKQSTLISAYGSVLSECLSFWTAAS